MASSPWRCLPVCCPLGTIALHRLVPWVGKPTCGPISIAIRWSLGVETHSRSRPRATTGERSTDSWLCSLAASQSP